MRLVSKQWNEVVLSLPHPKLGLELNLGEGLTLCNAHKYQEFASTMNPKLARRISIQENCTCKEGHNAQGIVQCRTK